MKHDRITPVWINSLKENEVFVFGSNTAGIHGAGAAKQAVTWGAKYGVGFGISGNTYAIPTKDKKMMTLDLQLIGIYVEGFLVYARQHSEKKFLVTEIGCGLAGYRRDDIAPLFRDAVVLKNVYLPERFLKILGVL